MQPIHGTLALERIQGIWVLGIRDLIREPHPSLGHPEQEGPPFGLVSFLGQLDAIHPVEAITGGAFLGPQDAPRVI
jgi:hypothetical protein